MKFNFVVLPLFFFSFSITLAHADLNLIKSTCKTSAKINPNINYDFCTSSFTSSKSSKTANLHGLGSISINLIRRNVTDSHRVINRLMKNKKLEPYVKQCLADCLELYNEAIDSVKQGRKLYKAKKYEEANVRITTVMDSVTSCEDGFKEKKGLISPINKWNGDTFQLSAISLSVMHMVETGSSNYDHGL